MDYSTLPPLNAGLNLTSGLLIILGLVMIKKNFWKAHALTMVMAMFTSTLFLISYLVYHYHHGSEPFTGTGFIRPVYFTILITHTILAILVVPLVFVTLYHAMRGRFTKHAKIARITFPVWLYVSITGVIIYWMLYHVYA